ncbi:MAG: NAD(P)/FAD-dependent oxidoreductase [Planctomycetota bacterium]|jgi:protoporphyrinogen oxidase
MSQPVAIIIGAGPAGLTAAYELLKRTDVKPIVLEKSRAMGGLAQTVNYRGNRIDIGGHRFFSKSDRVMQWWLERLPLEATGVELPFERELGERPDPETVDRVMLLRSRRSRIYFERQFFDYPVRLSLDTVRKLGFLRVLAMGLSYARSAALPIRNAASLEQFFINRFGRKLYRTFFKSYTEKVWGMPCSEISAEWGSQRIKGLSIRKALLHALKKPFQRRDVAQKNTETSLIEQFLYPKYGPGQMWEHVADEVRSLGGEILTNQEVRRVDTAGSQVVAVEAADAETGRSRVFRGDYFFSTMPVKQLVRSFSTPAPDPIRGIAEGLVYRDFITVGLLLDELAITEQTDRGPGLVRDNWIYIQEPDVRVGRMQIFNNWSPYLVADPSKVWVGMEYFCNEHDDLWIKPEQEMTAMASEELAPRSWRKSGSSDARRSATPR